MRPTPWLLAEPHRIQVPPHYVSAYGDDFGTFQVVGPSGQVLSILANDAHEDSAWWEHVSVSLRNRCPNWPEMDFVKDLFWLPTETVMQLHVPKSDHVNFHSFCLHLWRPTRAEIPRPPAILVGSA